jgi:hypothetical protein
MVDLLHSVSETILNYHDCPSGFFTCNMILLEDFGNDLIRLPFISLLNLVFDLEQVWFYKVNFMDHMVVWIYAKLNNIAEHITLGKQDIKQPELKIDRYNFAP